jgi:antitoxin component of MazEF toxin-antitoxin module
MEEAGIAVGDEVDVQVRRGAIILRPARRARGKVPEEVAQFASLNGPIDAWDVLEADIAAEREGRPTE